MPETSSPLGFPNSKEALPQSREHKNNIQRYLPDLKFGSRYPQLLHKAHDLGHHAIASYIWDSELIRISAGASVAEKIWGNFVNWIWSMRIGMSFGLAMGALLHTVLVTVFLPVPIALDVLVAHQLYTHGVPAPYVMLFLFTLGTYSILPMIFLWQEVSRELAVELYVMFVALGLVAAYTVGFLV